MPNAKGCGWGGLCSNAVVSELGLISEVADVELLGAADGELLVAPRLIPSGVAFEAVLWIVNAVFAGAFELIPPSPFLIDRCIEQVYLDKGWNINERNDGTKPYPTMQELYDSLKVAVEDSGYEGESRANIRSVMEVRIGSLLRRECRQMR